MASPVTRTTDLADFQRVVGEPHAREAGVGDAIDGVMPRWVAEPGTVEEASRVLALAHVAGLAVAPRGGGSKLALGNPPARLDLVLSTARLNRIIEHAAGDLIVAAEAGVSLDRVQQHVASAGQRLALDPPESGATLGGIVAANASGPLRLRYGTARDLLIGMTYVLADGTVARAGGKVVKNVAGYDLNKLFTGSLGTLGLLAEVIFRLHPLAAASRLVALAPQSSAALEAAAQRILHSQVVPSVLEYTWRGDGGTLLALFEGVEPGAAAQAGAALHLIEDLGTGSVHSGDRADALWQETVTGDDADAVVLKVTHLPTQLAAIIEEMGAAAHRTGVEIALGGRAGNGISLATLRGPVDRMASLVRLARSSPALAQSGGSVVVLRAPAVLKREVDAWGPVGNALPLMRRVKDRFDPGHILNPGRFVEGI